MSCAKAIGQILVEQSAANLGQCAQSADFHLQEIVLLRLGSERATEKRREWKAFAKRSAQVHLIVTEKARPQPTIGGEPYPIAAAAIGVGHGCDDADGATTMLEAVVTRRSVSPLRA